MLTNKLCLWRDSILYLGNSLDPQVHRHHAVQCCIALNGQLQIRSLKSDRWQPCQTAIIGANVPHSIMNPDGPICLLYLEKTSNDYHSILDYQQVTGVDPEAPLILEDPIPQNVLDLLMAAVSSQIDSRHANELRETCLQIFHGQISTQIPIDARISLLLKHLHEQPGRQFTGVELANLVNLSESRMQHLFKRQIGIPIRRYVLWVRMRHVLELTLTGVSVTSAAHEAGFFRRSPFFTHV